MLLDFSKTGADIILPPSTSSLDISVANVDDIVSTWDSSNFDANMDFSKCKFVVVYDKDTRCLKDVVNASDPGELKYVDNDNKDISYDVVVVAGYIFDIKSFKFRNDVKPMSEVYSPMFHKIFGLCIPRDTVIAVYNPYFDSINKILLCDTNVSSIITKLVDRTGVFLPGDFKPVKTITSLNYCDMFGEDWECMAKNFNRGSRNSGEPIEFSRLGIEMEAAIDEYKFIVNPYIQAIQYVFRNRDLNGYQRELAIWYAAIIDAIQNNELYDFDSDYVKERIDALSHPFDAYKTCSDEIRKVYSIDNEHIDVERREHYYRSGGCRLFKRKYWYTYKVVDNDQPVMDIHTGDEFTLLPGKIYIHLSPSYVKRAPYTFSRKQLIEIGITDHWDSDVSICITGDRMTEEYVDRTKVLVHSLVSAMTRMEENIKYPIRGCIDKGVFTSKVRFGDEVGTLKIYKSNGDFASENISFHVNLHNQSTALRIFLSLFSNIEE
jgi:hypothetical protein